MSCCAELVDQLLEALAGLRRREVVLLELAHLAGEVGRQHVELHVALVGGLAAASSCAALVAGLARLVVCSSRASRSWSTMSRSSCGDVVVDAAEVVALELVLAACAGASRASRGGPASRSPLRSRKPDCIIRRSAVLRSPWYSRSSVISSSTASASSSNPTCVPSHREYLNRPVMDARYRWAELPMRGADEN